MRVPLDRVQRPDFFVRHVIRITGADDDVEAALHHAVAHPIDIEALPSQIREALRYIEGKAVVLADPPDYFVPAGFEATEFAITRGAGYATIVAVSFVNELDLVRLFAAFHPKVLVEVTIADQIGDQPEVFHTFKGGEQCPLSVADPGRFREMNAGLIDPTWEETTQHIHGTVHDLASREMTGPAGHVRVSGPIERVQAFCERLLDGDEPYTACHLEQEDEDTLLVHLRLVPSEDTASFLAGLWSAANRDLEVEAVVTRTDGSCRRQRFVGGKIVLDKVSALDDRQVHATFGHRVTQQPTFWQTW